MKSVLISIKPQWCELIANEKKTVEVRKTKPKLETPFKCYIYCTGKDYEAIFCIDKFMHKVFLDGNGKQKIIGEFVCDKIDEYRYGVYEGEFDYHIPTVEGEKTCMEYTEAEEYGNGNPLYFWHISDLVIYDKPRKINEFVSTSIVNTNCFGQHLHKLNKPPQSWCYAKYERSGE